MGHERVKVEVDAGGNTDMDTTLQKCRIELFGGLCLDVGGLRVTRFRTRKTAELLAYLAYYSRRTHPREVLIELHWPECDSDSGRHNLSMALSSLRAVLDPPERSNEVRLVADRYTVGLNPVGLATDVAEFEEAIRSTSQARTDGDRIHLLERAVSLYSGELLPGYYQDWIFPEQQRLEETYSQGLRQLILHLNRAGDFVRALKYALICLTIDPFGEEAHRDVMSLYVATGQPEGALRQYRKLEQKLRQELQTEPEEETQALFNAIESSALKVDRAIAGSRTDRGDLQLSQPAVPSIAHDDWLEPVGGAVPLDSRFYLTRPTDAEFHAAIARHDSIVLVKGSRQVGKTSLLARGLDRARRAGFGVVLSHFQLLNSSHFECADALLLALAQSIAEQLNLEADPADHWDPRRGATPSFRRYLRREVLSNLSAPMVWGLDGVDLLFSCSFGSEIFGLFRSWYDARALDPQGPWAGLTLAMAYSTEAHLFISDVNQSPFNVGTRLSLDDFTLAQVLDLNWRYGSPLRDQDAVARFYGLVSGHPYLVRRGLHEMAVHGVGIASFAARASSDDWILSDHLHRIAGLVAKDAELRASVQAVLNGAPCPTRESFYRLRSAGVLVGDSIHDARFRCPLYADHLRAYLA